MQCDTLNRVGGVEKVADTGRYAMFETLSSERPVSPRRMGFVTMLSTGLEHGQVPQKRDRDNVSPSNSQTTAGLKSPRKTKKVGTSDLAGDR